MKKTLVALMVLSVSLSGCLWRNTDAVPLADIHHPDFTGPHQGNAVIVYGVQDAEIVLSEYSLNAKDKEGNCVIFNRTRAKNDANSLHYYAFNVAAGYYAYSPSHMPFGVPGSNKSFLPLYDSIASTAFYAPEGKTVYIGDFLGEKEGLTFNRDLPAAQKALELPTLELADTKAVEAESSYIVCF